MPSSSSSSSSGTPKVKLGPNPTLLSRKEVDALYEMFEIVVKALDQIGVNYIVTGGSLLGAIRQHSILFCDDDIDIAIIEENEGNESVESNSTYSKVQSQLQDLIDKTKKKYVYQIKPWEGGDRVRPKHINTVFIDLFVIRKYETLDNLKSVIGIKKNGQSQPKEYVNNVVTTMIHRIVGFSGHTALQRVSISL